MFEAPRAMPEPSDQDYPFLLLTGRGLFAMAYADADWQVFGAA